MSLPWQLIVEFNLLLIIDKILSFYIALYKAMTL